MYPSFLYEGFDPLSSDCGSVRSSIKTSRIKLLITFAPTGTYVRDHRTTPEVVTISNVSSIIIIMAGGVRRETGAGSVSVPLTLGTNDEVGAAVARWSESEVASYTQADNDN